MKQKTLLSLLLLLTPAFFLPLHAESEKVDNLYYELDATTKTAKIVSDNSYSSLKGSLSIPGSITASDGQTYTVTEIGDWAFQNCSFGDNSTTNKYTLTIPNTIKIIGSRAFASCNGLSGDIVIPESVEILSAGAFSGAHFDGQIIFKNSPTKIEPQTFAACNWITGAIVIPNSVKEIGESAFSGCTEVTSLTIPEGVETIGYQAFHSLRSIKGTLTIPKSVTSIGVGALADMQELSAFSVASGNTKYVAVKGLLFDINKTVLIACPAGLTCTEKTFSSDLPTTVVEIGEYAAAWCKKYTGPLKLSSKITKIGDWAFYNCMNLTGDLDLSNVTSIGTYAFNWCESLNGTITFNQNLTSISQSAFSVCRNLVGPLKFPSTLTYIGPSAFSSCSSLTGNLTIPESVTTIERSAFNGCSKLSGDLVIPNNVRTLGQSAFENCSGFKGTLTISNSITQIYPSTFSGCTGLTGTLNIPSSAHSIGSKAFSNCSGFTGVVTLSNKYLSIGSGAFDGCMGITDFLIMNSSVPTMSGNAFNNISNQCKIIVSANLADKYKSANYWKNYSTRIYELGDANINKTTDITDVVTVCNNIIGKSNSSFYFLCADFNCDNRISISDATGIVSAVLVANPSSSSIAYAPGLGNADRYLAIDNFNLYEGASDVNVGISSMSENVVAFQADFFGEDGLRIEDVSISPELAATHSLSTARLENGALRVVVFSLANALIPTDSAAITLHVSGFDGNITASNCIASDQEGSSIVLGVSGGLGTTGVGSVNAGEGYVSSDADGITVCNASGSKVGIFNLAGQMVCNITAVSDFETIPLPQGIYIVRINNNSHKIIVK